MRCKHEDYNSIEVNVKNNIYECIMNSYESFNASYIEQEPRHDGCVNS